MFRPKPIAALLLVSLVFPFGQRVDGSDFRPSPPFAGSILLEPPQQKAAWTAPTVDLPATLATAVAALFRDGMADPRGLCVPRSGSRRRQLLVRRQRRGLDARLGAAGEGRREATLRRLLERACLSRSFGRRCRGPKG